MLQVCIGIVIGYILGSVGMLLLIRETKTDDVIERQVSNVEMSFDRHDIPRDEELPWNTEELPEPKEVDYGGF